MHENAFAAAWKAYSAPQTPSLILGRERGGGGGEGGVGEEGK